MEQEKFIKKVIGKNMGLKLMYITNNPVIAEIAENAGVDRIFIDMEYIGKDERQAGLDTVKSHHTIDDIKMIRSRIHKAELLVRVNPIHEETMEYMGSFKEINAAIDAGADILMLPMFRTLEEIKTFIDIINGRVKTMLLVETVEAMNLIEEIIKIKGIDEIHIGLNDLHLALNKKFMFELLVDGTVEKLCNSLSKANIPYGFGGIARLGYGELSAEYVITEHYRLGSTLAILSRSFCNANKIENPKEIEYIFKNGIQQIRDLEEKVSSFSEKDFQKNRQIIYQKVNEIVEKEDNREKKI